MPAPPYRVFFDTSVYIAALISPSGAAGELVRLAEAGAICMVVSERVIVESDEVLRNKFPELVERSRDLWRHLQPDVVSDPPQKQVGAFKKLLPPADASILCAASKAEVSAFVTWNTRHFMRPDVESLVEFPIVVPSECLALFMKWVEPYLE